MSKFEAIEKEKIKTFIRVVEETLEPLPELRHLKRKEYGDFNCERKFRLNQLRYFINDIEQEFKC